jgi:hypothetical protein
MHSLAQKNDLTRTKSYHFDNFISCMQKEIDSGISLYFSNISTVPTEYIEMQYPGVQYVSCDVKVISNISIEFKDLFILKDDKIVKITDYIEKENKKTGEKKVNISYVDLARTAFADKDYLKCYSLYKTSGLKELNASSLTLYENVFPYVESCIALDKWDDAMHGLTDNHRIMNKKTWISGIEYELTANDIKTWNKGKEELLHHLFKKLCYFYCSDVPRFRESPLVHHISNITNVSVDELMKDAAQFIWSDRNNWAYNKEGWLKHAAEYGHIEAQRLLGISYLAGFNQSKGDDYTSASPEANTSCDSLSAIFWLEKSATGGDIDAAKIIAPIYLMGNGISKDYSKAFSFYKMHETEIDFDIQYGLGICYYYGLGIEKNTQLALSHLIASEDWHDEVPYLIGSIYYENSDERAIKYLTKALSSHSLNDAIRCEALFKLSDCYRHGKCGISINIEEADRLATDAKKYKRLTQQCIEDYFVSLSQIKIDYDSFKAIIY